MQLKTEAYANLVTNHKYLCGYCTHTHTLSSFSLSLSFVPISWPLSQMNLPIMRSRLLQCRLTANIADYRSFPLHCSFPPLPSLTLCLLLMNSGSYAINNIWTITPPPPFSSLHTPFISLSVSHLIPFQSLSHLATSVQYVRRQKCEVCREKENMSAKEWERERKWGPGLTVRWPSRRIFLSQHCQRTGSALQTHKTLSHMSSCAT